MYLCNGYQDTLEFFGYVIIGAPDFSPEDKMTLIQAFQELRHGIDTVRAETKDENGRQLLQQCRSEVDRSLSFFQDGRRREARHCLQIAERYFIEVRNRHG